MSSNPNRVKLGVLGTSVLSRSSTKHIRKNTNLATIDYNNMRQVNSMRGIKLM